MKTKRLFLIMTVTILVVGLFAGSAFAGAYETSFTTSITYQNVGDATTTGLEVWFYESPDDTEETRIVRPNLAAGAGTSLFIGGLSQLGTGFQGTAIMVSDQPLVSTLVQLPQNSATVKNRPLSNGFTNGTEDSLIATVLKNMFGGFYTMFSVQNAGSSATDVDIKFLDTSATVVHSIDNQTLEPGAGYFVDTGTIPDADIGASFNGSVVIESDGGSIISSAMELQSGTGTAARAFEGLGAGADRYNMPSALCDFPITGGVANTFYAVQNTSTSSDTNVTVNYSNGTSETKPVGPGAKASFAACSASGMPTGFLGSAVVTSDTTDIIAIGKAEGVGLSTAFVGIGAGSDKIALPYVRWATDANYNSGVQQRVYIAIQNVGSSQIAANEVTVSYIDRNGVTVGTHTINQAIPTEGKVNSNATNAGLSEFGVYDNGTAFGGGVIIQGPAGSELAAIARVESFIPASGLRAGEDYNGIDISSP